ncbi:MAG: hypothetical protein EKK40_13800 [Bradyrhizobiaceae bacterium]|nr:MAG: hypothetical protein EKK40_13800 [Bradyrhizobiaceae bacterium]
METPAANDKGYALAVYLLYLIGFLTGITALVGVIIAYVKKPTATGFLQSHFQFQVRTFWIGLLYLGVGSFLLFLYVGGPILLWWFVWTLVRTIKGLILLNDGRPIPQPTSWLFG